MMTGGQVHPDPLSPVQHAGKADATEWIKSAPSNQSGSLADGEGSPMPAFFVATCIVEKLMTKIFLLIGVLFSGVAALLYFAPRLRLLNFVD
ncbi:hypothetical protein MasN3_08270 [Massilia varians]|uniref:Uncharacterized protein n=1 Tax=Massilia varians TaxID=457921 RepID=A0ABN6T9Z2_9BURK|nr:hypothetical protein MasN3_08270 [Massilia varians]